MRAQLRRQGIPVARCTVERLMRAVRGDSPFRTGPITTLADLEDITSARVHWYNTSRLMHRLGRRPPAEAEADYYAPHRDGQPAVHT